MSTETAPNGIFQLRDRIRSAPTQIEKLMLLMRSELHFKTDDLLRFGRFGMKRRGSNGRQRVSEGVKYLWGALLKTLHKLSRRGNLVHAHKFHGDWLEITRQELMRITCNTYDQVAEALRQLEAMGWIERCHPINPVTGFRRLWIRLVPEKVAEMLAELNEVAVLKAEPVFRELAVKKSTKGEKSKQRTPDDYGGSCVEKCMDFVTKLSSSDSGQFGVVPTPRNKEKFPVTVAGEYLLEEGEQKAPQIADLTVLPESLDVDLRTGKVTKPEIVQVETILPEQVTTPLSEQKGCSSDYLKFTQRPVNPATRAEFDGPVLCDYGDGTDVVIAEYPENSIKLAETIYRL